MTNIYVFIILVMTNVYVFIISVVFFISCTFIYNRCQQFKLKHMAASTELAAAAMCAASCHAAPLPA